MVILLTLGPGGYTLFDVPFVCKVVAQEPDHTEVLTSRTQGTESHNIRTLHHERAQILDTYRPNRTGGTCRVVSCERLV